ncbi:MAG: hypothetical protein WCO60_19640 [Verrucomicrobiota bacterium]
MNKQLTIVLNGKGGVGKSFFATNFVQYLKDHGIEHHAIDTDNENSTLTRFHPEAQFVSLTQPQELDAVFLALEKGRLVIVDCRAASSDIFIDYFAEIQAFDLLDKLDTALTVVSPVNHEADSVEQLKVVIAAFDARCRYVIVRNQVHSEHFRLYDGSQTRNALLNRLGAREILMPRLYEWLVTGLSSGNHSITAAIAGSDFSLVDRQRLKNWQNAFYRQIEAASDLLLPPGLQVEAAK